MLCKLWALVGAPRESKRARLDNGSGFDMTTAATPTAALAATAGRKGFATTAGSRTRSDIGHTEKVCEGCTPIGVELVIKK